MPGPVTRVAPPIVAGVLLLAGCASSDDADEPAPTSDQPGTQHTQDEQPEGESTDVPDDTVGEPVPDVTSWDELESALAATGADVSVVATVDGEDTWTAVHQSVGGGELLPLGSVFKLYLLGAVQRAVIDGDISWDDELTVTDALRSLPTGELQDAADGTAVTVAEAAEKMISIRDNTATDMLMELVGRDAAEAAVAEMGHADPAVLRPFLSTRELFQLGWTDPELRETWREADAGERDAILGGLPDGPLDVDGTDIVDPVWPDGIEWFATGADITEAHLALQELATQDPSDTARDLLSVNPGVRIDAGAWPYVAYKGGAAPGVFALSWYAEDADGVAHTMAIQLAAEDPNALADVDYIVEVAEQGFGLLAED